ncbi:MAG TPA: peptidoglycan-binding domain-containing protein [Pseudolabrys sp.]|jgi:peptidoglycan hydrolase-like protein with peptidoglycan-binding domain|nr:peptidoglycan-binding domain-containing protein [Pseudolabrys sp.]
MAIEGAGRLAAAISEHPREFVALLMATAAIFAIVVNALFLQKGPHPAPIFAARPLLPQEATLAPRLPGAQQVPASETNSAARLQLIVNIQRELTRKGFYDGTADGIWGAKTDSAVRDFIQTAGLKGSAEASEGLLRAITASTVKPASASGAAPASDPIARLIAPAPSKRVMAVQRALADFGYGQIKPTGFVDADTKAAVEKFERDRRLPIDGQITDRFVRDLAAMTGRPLE